MFRSILLCSFLAYVSTTTEGTDGWFTDTDRSCMCNGIRVDMGGYGIFVEGEPVPELCTTLKGGRPFCFVNPSDCQDSVPSSLFPDLYWSYEACEVESF
eukprot:GFUD01041528.1.p1 GENE.GFUD01041528.1~~GFUD01041528.1.p1  ORF type:complete len:115 (+),score=1.34 GFUD01041528.1:51-347(+)